MSGRLLEFGREWGTRIKGLFETPLTADAPPLEILQAVLDDLERRIRPAGRGRRSFPYCAVVVRLAPSADAEATVAVFEDLPARLRERLRELECDVPDVLEVSVDVLGERPQDWPEGRLFVLECRRPAVSRARQVPGEPVTVEITVVKGAAEEPVYAFTGGQISIGRTPEAIDDVGRARRNMVAFLDTLDGITETVGRAHARLRPDPAGGGYLVFDDGSRNGTSIIRDGETIRVPPRDPRGIRLQSGDELQLGRARVGVRFVGGS